MSAMSVNGELGSRPELGWGQGCDERQEKGGRHASRGHSRYLAYFTCQKDT